MRDFLLRVANTGLYRPHWTDLIQEEWIRNLLANRPDLKRKDLERTKKAMNDAFPGADIIDFEEIIETLELPDVNDKHVLAAAIKGQCNIIVTNNKKDFPAKYVREFRIAVRTPDNLICDFIEENKIRVELALYEQVQSLRNPPQLMEQLLRTLENCGLRESVGKLR